MALASGCASCVFGAVASRTLALGYDTIVAATVTVIPHVAVYPNGSQSTSWETDRQSVTEVVGSASSQGAVETFSDINSITWTVDGATLTWPTSYVQYLGFKGAAVTNNIFCADAAGATPVSLPTTVDPASLIYPITHGATGAMPLPTPLLEYLDQLDLVASQFDGDALAGCAPLDSSSLVARHEMDRRKRFEGARRDVYPEARAASPAFTQANSTSHAISASSTVPSISQHGISSSEGPSSTSNLITSSSLVPSSSQSSIPITLSASLPPNGTFSSNGTCVTMNGTCITLTPGRFTQHRRPGFPVPMISSAVPAPEPSGGTNGPIYTHKSAVGLTTTTLPPIITKASPTKGHSNPKQTKQHSNPDPPPNKPAPGKQHTSKGSTGHHGGGGVPGLISIIGKQHTPKDPKERTSVFTVGKSTFTEKPGGVVIGTRTVHPGQKITIGKGTSQTTLAVHTKNGHTHLVVDGTTYRPSQLTRDPAGSSPGVVITTKGHTITIMRSGSSVIVKDGHSKTTMPAGTVITFGGQTISAPRYGGTIVVNGTPEPGNIVTEAVITAGDHTITAIEESRSIILEDASSTAIVKDGGVITFDGQTISAGKNGSAIVVNGKTFHVTTTAIVSNRSGRHPNHATQEPNRAAHITSSGDQKAHSSSAGARVLLGAVDLSCLALTVLLIILAIL